MNNRGVLYISYGDEAKKQRDKSIETLRKSNPDIYFATAEFDLPPEHKSLLIKCRMMDISPFEETCYLDSDTYIYDKLDYGFEQASIHGIACCINECPNLSRYELSPTPYSIEYNTGVMFFNKKILRAQQIFEQWKNNIQLDSSIEFMLEQEKPAKMSYNDQFGFSLACEQLHFQPFILPMNWNYRVRFIKQYFGKIIILHHNEPIPDWFEEHNKTVEPFRQVIIKNELL